MKTLHVANGRDLTQKWLVKSLATPVPAENASVGCQPYPEILRAHDQTQAAVFEFSHIDGRPRFAKPSIADGKKVRIAAIDPDFRLRRQPLSLMECAGRFLYSLSSFSLPV